MARILCEVRGARCSLCLYSRRKPHYMSSNKNTSFDHLRAVCNVLPRTACSISVHCKKITYPALLPRAKVLLCTAPLVLIRKAQPAQPQWEMYLLSSDTEDHLPLVSFQRRRAAGKLLHRSPVCVLGLGPGQISIQLQAA